MSKKNENEIILKEIELIADEIEYITDEEIDFSMLQMIKFLLKEKENKTKLENLIEKQVNEVIDSVYDRPSYYFNTKEKNLEKIIENKIDKKALPKKDERFANYSEVSINTIEKLIDSLKVSSEEQKLILKVKKDIMNIKKSKNKSEIKRVIKKSKDAINRIVKNKVIEFEK